MPERSLTSEETLREAIAYIEKSRMGLAPVTDDAGRLLGTITDGDIRRCILDGGTLETRLSQAMNRSPVTARDSTPLDEVAQTLTAKNLEAMPLVDGDGLFFGVVHLRDLHAHAPGEGELAGAVAAVVMAGGEGLRLRPLTESLPKPMIEVGGKTVIERHVERLIKAEVPRIFVSVNYLGEMIEAHLARFEKDVELRYLRETEKLGTAGALSLLPDLPLGPILVLNGDVVHTANYGNLLNFHLECSGSMTVSVIEHNIQVPFGVVRTSEGQLVDLAEKPNERFLCNAGIYVLDDGARQVVQPQRMIDMTDIMMELCDAGQQINVFPLHEYWADIGNLKDLERVRQDAAKFTEGAE